MKADMKAPRRLLPIATASPVEHARPVAWVGAGLLAQMLDVSESTIWDWAKRGVLPRPNRIGGVTRWKWAEVEKRIESGSDAGDEDDPILRASRGR